MRSFFQHYLSYLWDVQVDYRESSINGDLIVFLVKGKYQLCTANAIYSFENQYDNFGNLFRHKLNMPELPGNRVLVLGLGLGSVPIILDELYPQNWKFTAVDIDTEVCELAAIYGYSKILSPIETIIADARSFIESCRDEFDLVCIDIFIDDIVPEECLSAKFLKQIDNCLSPKGLVIANTLAFSEKHRIQSKEYFEKVFKQIFPKAVRVHTHKNFMLISDKHYLINK